MLHLRIALKPQARLGLKRMPPPRDCDLRARPLPVMHPNGSETKKRGTERPRAPAQTLGVAVVSGPSAIAPESKWQSLPIGPQSCTSTSLHAMPQPSAQAMPSREPHPQRAGGGQHRKWATSPAVGHALGKLGGARAAYGEGLTHLRALEWVSLRAVTNRCLGAVANRASHCPRAVL